MLKAANDLPFGVVSRNHVEVEFIDQYGEKRIIHKQRNSRLSVARDGETVVHALNRSAAVLTAQNIRCARLAAGLTLRGLCVKAGMTVALTKQRMSEIENAGRGRYTSIRMGTLHALAAALGMDAKDLLPSTDEVMRHAHVKWGQHDCLRVSA